jgi:hypothetical protein
VFKVPPADVWAFFKGTVETVQLSQVLGLNVVEGESGCLDARDPGDRANGPGAWPTLSRSDDVTDLIERVSTA